MSDRGAAPKAVETVAVTGRMFPTGSADVRPTAREIGGTIGRRFTGGRGRR